jgi:hypothetical protein
MKKDFLKKLKKISKKGARGYPIATVAYYGPDNKRASKVAVGIVPSEGADPEKLERWISETTDVRKDVSINEQIYNFIKSNDARSVVITDGIIGCPHEEGIDYPENSSCPQCPFWAIRDRFIGEIIH